MRLKISWLINWSTLSKKSLLLGLSAWRKVLFSWWARILPRKLSLIRAEKWKRRPQLHQESDQIFFQPLHLHPHIGGPNNSAWGDVGSHKVMGMSVDRWKIMGMKVGSTLKGWSKSRDQSGEVKGFFSASRGRENWLWRKQSNLQIFQTIQINNWGLLSHDWEWSQNIHFST